MQPIPGQYHAFEGLALYGRTADRLIVSQRSSYELKS